MVIEKIQNEIYALFGAFFYDEETETQIAAYIYDNYPSNNYYVVIAQGWTSINIDFVFDSQEDYLLFVLKYL